MTFSGDDDDKTRIFFNDKLILHTNYEHIYLSIGTNKTQIQHSSWIDSQTQPPTQKHYIKQQTTVFTQQTRTGDLSTTQHHCNSKKTSWYLRNLNPIYTINQSDPNRTIKARLARPKKANYCIRRTRFRGSKIYFRTVPKRTDSIQARHAAINRRRSSKKSHLYVETLIKRFGPDLKRARFKLNYVGHAKLGRCRASILANSLVGVSFSYLSMHWLINFVMLYRN